MHRRVFLGALGLLAAPRVGETQQAGRIYRVGIVSIGTDPKQPLVWRPFLDGMRELGYVEGRNLSVGRAFASGRAEDLPRLIQELLRSGVEVIVATGTREVVALKQATSTIPVVMLVIADPVGQGFVKSLARPGGNVTGMTNLVPGLVQKYVELLRQALPQVSRIAMIASPPNPLPDHRSEVDAAARAFGMVASIVQVTGPNDFDEALARAKRDGVGAIIAAPDGVTFLNRRRLVQTAIKYRLPGIYWTREYVEEGGLMTYSADLPELRRRAATFVDKILKGAKPADLPVEQPTKFELVITSRPPRRSASRSRRRCSSGPTR